MDKNTGEMRAEGMRHIRDDIRHTEEEMAETIHAIEERLSPSRLRERLVEKVREQASAGAEKAKTALRSNPRASAAAGAGIALVALLSMRRKKRRAAMRGVPQAAAMPQRQQQGKAGAGMLGLLIGAALAFGLPTRLAEGARTRMAGREEPGPMAVPPGIGGGAVEEPGRIIK